MLISVSKIVLTILDKTDIINDTNKYASKMKDRKSNVFIESRHGLVENFGPRVLEIKEIDRQISLYFGRLQNKYIYVTGIK